MRMGTGVQVLPNGQEHNGESCAASTSELSTHNCGLSLMKAQESIQQFCVQERMTDVEGNHFKMGVDDWDIIGQCTASLMTVAAVVKQTEGDKYPTNSLVLSFMNSCMRSLSEDAPIKQTWLRTANVRREFPVSSAHTCV